MRTLSLNLRFLVLCTVVQFTPGIDLHSNFIIFQEFFSLN